LPQSVADAGPYGARPDAWLVEKCHEAASDSAIDEAAFTEIVRRYRDKVFRLAVSILGQPFAPEAEDAAQDVMLRVHRSIRGFRNESTLGSWIYRIAFNHALNIKSRMRYRAPHVGDEILATASSSERSPLDRLEDARRQRAVLECIAELPEVYQSALRLHYWLGVGIAEIAEMLDAPENTVKSYLHRARKLLHARLSERGIHER